MWWQLSERPPRPGAELDQSWTVVLPDIWVRLKDRTIVSSQKEKEEFRQEPQPRKTRISVRRSGGNSAPEEQAWSIVTQKLSHNEQEKSPVLPAGQKVSSG